MRKLRGLYWCPNGGKKAFLSGERPWGRGKLQSDPGVLDWPAQGHSMAEWPREDVTVSVGPEACDLSPAYSAQWVLRGYTFIPGASAELLLCTQHHVL